MRTFNFEAWYRYNDEKDFYQGEVGAINWESAENKIRETDKRVFKIEKIESLINE